MTRRKAYTKVEKENEIRAEHVKGMGDVVFKGLHCLNPACQNFLFIRKDDISDFFEIPCSVCGYVHQYGNESKFYDYKLRDRRDNSVIQEGEFTILHDDYLAEAKEFKYCIICSALKPLEFFDRHSARKSGRQGECRLCKGVYNGIKNQTRTTDQHREAAQKRRLYMELAGGAKIDSKQIYERFGYKCFKCGKDLSQDIQEKSAEQGGNLDHTLPAKFLWPLTNENATLLCRKHNGDKAESWPSEFYTDKKLRRLVTLTGIPYDVLAGKPFYNPDAIEKLRDPAFVDELLTKYAAYMDEMITVRNRILNAAKLDIFAVSKTLSKKWIELADKKRK
jgi:DNA-directed RNA polymerase subunit M/transcription elongation factor TFIIS